MPKRDLHKELRLLPGDARTPALLVVHALYGIVRPEDGEFVEVLDDHHVAASWPKLEGRPAGQVRWLLDDLEDEEPEQIMTRIREFSRRHKPMP